MVSVRQSLDKAVCELKQVDPPSPFAGQGGQDSVCLPESAVCEMKQDGPLPACRCTERLYEQHRSWRE